MRAIDSRQWLALLAHEFPELFLPVDAKVTPFDCIKLAMWIKQNRWLLSRFHLSELERIATMSRADRIGMHRKKKRPKEKDLTKVKR